MLTIRGCTEAQWRDRKKQQNTGKYGYHTGSRNKFSITTLIWLSPKGDNQQGERHLKETSDTEASFFYLHLTVSDGFVKSKIDDKRDNFNFNIVNFPFLDGDVPRSASYGV